MAAILTEEEERDIILRELGKFAQEGEKKDKEEVDDEPPEDCIPDLPENRAARDFLRKAPSRGLHMPLGIDVKVMQCFRCKAFGHRTGDRECPLRESGNIILDSERQAREDPMSAFVAKKMKERQERHDRVKFLKLIVDEIRAEERERKKRKKDKKDKKKSKKKSRTDL